MLFLQEVRRRSPRLFAVFTVFLIITWYCDKKNVTFAPLMNWDMYSGYFGDIRNYPFYEIEYNNGKRVNLTHPAKALRRNFLYTPVSNYDYLSHHTFQGPYDDKIKAKFNHLLRYTLSTVPLFNNDTMVGAFPVWFRNRLSQTLKTSVDSFKVYKIELEYNQHHTNLTSKVLILKG